MKTMRLGIQLGLPVIILSLMIGACAPPKSQTDQVNIRMEAAATNINPLLTTSGYNAHIASLVFQTLGVADPTTMELKPTLVKTIPAVRRVTEGPHKGETAYDFEINELATWDNGQPVTGEDVVFTFKTILHPGLGSPFGSYFEYLSGVDVDAANAKKFTVYMRQYYILTLETLCTTPIYPMYNYDPQGRMKNVTLADIIDPEKGKAFAESAAGKAFTEEFSSPKYATDPQSISGSGPYRMKSMNGDQGMVLLKKQGWWGDKVSPTNPLLAAYPEQLVYKIVKDETATESLLQTGDLDIATDLTPADFKKMQQDTHLTRLYEFKTSWAPRYSRMLINLRHPDSNFLADVRVRQALAYAIDYDYLINTVQQGYAKKIVGPIHPVKPYYAKDISPYSYNPAEVKRLLTEAGWADTDHDGIMDKVINGRRIPLSIKLMIPTGSAMSEMVSQSIKDKARQLQIDISLDPQDINTMLKKFGEGDFQLAINSAVNATGLDDLTQYYQSSSAQNRGRYENPQLDSLTNAIRTTENEKVRNELYSKAQHIFYDDVPVIFLFASDRRYMISKKFNYVLTAEGLGYFEQMFQSKN